MRQIDRRWIFLCVAIAIALTVVYQFRQRITPSPSVKATYDYIQKLPPGSAILIVTDFDPQAKAELEPMTDALLEHCFRRGIRVVGMTFWNLGASMGNQLFRDAARRHGKVSGVDYVFLGFKPGAMPQVITNMAENIESAFPKDAEGRATAGMPIFSALRRLPELSYIIDIAAGATVDAWVVYAGDKYRIPMAAACTAVSGPDLYVYLNTGQINGLVAGLRGAADYEVLLGRPGPGVTGMPAQSTVHAIIILFVVAANAVYFWNRRAQKSRRETTHG
jgi:hypothetical protein